MFGVKYRFSGDGGILVFKNSSAFRRVEIYCREYGVERFELYVNEGYCFEVLFNWFYDIL